MIVGNQLTPFMSRYSKIVVRQFCSVFILF